MKAKAAACVFVILTRSGIRTFNMMAWRILYRLSPADTEGVTKNGDDGRTYYNITRKQQTSSRVYVKRDVVVTCMTLASLYSYMTGGRWRKGEGGRRQRQQSSPL